MGSGAGGSSEAEGPGGGSAGGRPGAAVGVTGLLGAGAESGARRRGGADPDGMSVSPFQGRPLCAQPRGGSGLARGLRGSGQFCFGVEAGRRREPDEMPAGS